MSRSTLDMSTSYTNLRRKHWANIVVWPLYTMTFIHVSLLRYQCKLMTTIISINGRFLSNSTWPASSSWIVKPTSPNLTTLAPKSSKSSSCSLQMQPNMLMNNARMLFQIFIAYWIKREIQPYKPLPLPSKMGGFGLWRSIYLSIINRIDMKHIYEHVAFAKNLKIRLLRKSFYLVFVEQV